MMQRSYYIGDIADRSFYDKVLWDGREKQCAILFGQKRIMNI